MKEAKKYQFWFCTGSQDLYGDDWNSVYYR